MKTSLGKPKLKAGIIYSGDNGRLFCVHCAGMSAKYTGHDISGLKVEACAFSETIAWQAEFGKPLACEHGCTTYAAVPCGFKGCKCAASHILTATIGRSGEIPLCPGHLPEWVRTGEPSAFAKQRGREQFTVAKL